MVDILINLQRIHCPPEKLLLEKDLKRIINKTGCLINNSNDCILWNGYITHNKIDYINFYFRGKKCALHRLLYVNFKGKLNDNDYLEYICPDKSNKGRCCNINHIIKKRYNNNIPIASPNSNVVYFD